MKFSSPLYLRFSSFSFSFSFSFFFFFFFFFLKVFFDSCLRERNTLATTQRLSNWTLHPSPNRPLPKENKRRRSVQHHKGRRCRVESSCPKLRRKKLSRRERDKFPPQRRSSCTSQKEKPNCHQ